MSLSETFAKLAARGEKALVLFVTAGDPPLEQLPAIVETLQSAGADVIEVGIPFSDPIADGPSIQASSQRALDRGVTPAAVLAIMKDVRLSVPAVAMGYYNPLLRMGLESSARRLREAGFSGTIVSDLTPEESDEWLAASRSNGLDSIFLAAPTSTDARLDEVCSRSSGFVYAVSRTGVTGAGQSAPPEVLDLLRRVKARTALPVCAGFGISKPEHVRMVCQVADGAVIGSALVELLAREWRDGIGREVVARQVAEWKAATRG